MRPYRAEASPEVPASPGRWPALHAEIGILVVCVAIIASGLWYRRFGFDETIAMLGALGSSYVIVSALLGARRAR